MFFHTNNAEVKMIDFIEFRKKFRYNSALAYHIGVERECFIANKNGEIIPQAEQVLVKLSGQNGYTVQESRGSYTPEPYGYELSACQIESRTKPVPLCNLHEELVQLDARLDWTLKDLGMYAIHTEVGPQEMPLDVYPDPTGRYAKIVKTMPRHVLLAACRVAGTHIHVGMPNHNIALHTYNSVIEQCQQLCAMGDHSEGKRLSIYKEVAQDCWPPRYSDWESFYSVAVKNKFDENPRNCWFLIRLTAHGTLEFRMFGATPSIDRIMDWATYCHRICVSAM